MFDYTPSSGKTLEDCPNVGIKYYIMATIKYNEATLFNANLEKLCPKKFKVTFETSGSPSCWTNDGPITYPGDMWNREFIDSLRRDVLREEDLKEATGPYGSDYRLDIVLIF